jgi:hypothetical protein
MQLREKISLKGALVLSKLSAAKILFVWEKTTCLEKFARGKFTAVFRLLMTADKSHQHPAETHSDEEVIAAVKLAQEELDAPAVPISEIVRKTDYTSIAGVRGKLLKIADKGELCAIRTGQESIFWVPEDGESGGEVDTSVLRPDNIDPDSIEPEAFSKEKAKEIAKEKLPSFSEPTYWQREYENGVSMMEFGGASFGIGLGVALLDSSGNTTIPIPEWVLPIAAILLIVGAFLVIVGALFMIFTYGGQRGAGRRYLSEEPFEDGIPASVKEKLK